MQYLLVLAATFLSIQSAQGDRVRSGVPVVINGGMLQIGRDQVAIDGIAAPALIQHCTNAAGEYYGCGRNSARALQELISGQTVQCRIVRRESMTAHCLVRGHDVGEAMLRAGHAVVARGVRVRTYEAAQTDARRNRRGLWSGRFLHPQDWQVQFRRSSPIAGCASLESC
jgi:endonuclease YncB( thermonuclease family)